MGLERDRIAVPLVLAAVALASVMSLGWLAVRGGGGGAAAAAREDAPRSAPGHVERLLADVVRVADAHVVVLRTEGESFALELEEPLLDTLAEGDAVEVEARPVGRSRFGTRYLRGKLRPVKGGKPVPRASAKSDAPPPSRSLLGEALKKRKVKR
jgi:hypothetical protein